jgi:hypothetical protein
MQMIRSLRQKWMVVALLLLPIFLISCGGGGGGGGGGGDNGDGGGSDFYKLSVGGGGETTYTEAHDPDIVCDPRVDWASNQIILYDNYLGGSNWELIFDIMLFDDSVGTYDVQVAGEAFVSYIPNSTPYTTNPNFSNSSGTITVTRSDSRIEGTFDVVVVDAGDSNPIAVTGSFGVESGNSLSCQ